MKSSSPENWNARAGSWKSGDSCALAKSTKYDQDFTFIMVDDKAWDILYDPAQNKYWRMFNDLEARTNVAYLKKSLNKSLKFFTGDTSREIRTEIS
ncbi:MAG: hypothetical protein ACOYOS_23730 [Syntrophales bacterium]